MCRTCFCLLLHINNFSPSTPNLLNCPDTSSNHTSVSFDPFLSSVSSPPATFPVLTSSTSSTPRSSPPPTQNTPIHIAHRTCTWDWGCLFVEVLSFVVVVIFSPLTLLGIPDVLGEYFSSAWCHILKSLCGGTCSLVENASAKCFTPTLTPLSRCSQPVFFESPYPPHLLSCRLLSNLELQTTNTLTGCLLNNTPQTIRCLTRSPNLHPSLRASTQAKTLRCLRATRLRPSLRA